MKVILLYSLSGVSVIIQLISLGRLQALKNQLQSSIGKHLKLLCIIIKIILSVLQQTQFVFPFFFRRRQHLSTHFKVKGDITLLVYEGRLHIIKMQNAEDNGCHGFSSRWLVHFGPCKSYEVFLPRWIISISWHLSGPSVQVIDC